MVSPSKKGSCEWLTKRMRNERGSVRCTERKMDSFPLWLIEDVFGTFHLCFWVGLLVTFARNFFWARLHLIQRGTRPLWKFKKNRLFHSSSVKRGLSKKSTTLKSGKSAQFKTLLWQLNWPNKKVNIDISKHRPRLLLQRASGRRNLRSSSTSQTHTKGK